MRLWDLAKGTLLSGPILHEKSVRAIALSPDGQLLASASDDGTLWRWDAMTGAPVGSPISHGSPIKVVGFSLDGSKITTAGRTELSCLWDARTGTAISSPGPDMTAKSLPPCSTLTAAGSRRQA